MDINLITLLQISPDTRRGLREVRIPITIYKEKKIRKKLALAPPESQRSQSRIASPIGSSRVLPKPIV